MHRSILCIMVFYIYSIDYFASPTVVKNMALQRYLDGALSKSTNAKENATANQGGMSKGVGSPNQQTKYSSFSKESVPDSASNEGRDSDTDSKHDVFNKNVTLKKTLSRPNPTSSDFPRGPKVPFSSSKGQVGDISKFSKNDMAGVPEFQIKPKNPQPNIKPNQENLQITNHVLPNQQQWMNNGQSNWNGFPNRPPYGNLPQFPNVPQLSYGNQGNSHNQQYTVNPQDSMLPSIVPLQYAPQNIFQRPVGLQQVHDMPQKQFNPETVYDSIQERPNEWFPYGKLDPKDVQELQTLSRELKQDLESLEQKLQHSLQSPEHQELLFGHQTPSDQQFQSSPKINLDLQLQPTPQIRPDYQLQPGSQMPLDHHLLFRPQKSLDNHPEFVSHIQPYQLFLPHRPPISQGQQFQFPPYNQYFQYDPRFSPNQEVLYGSRHDFEFDPESPTEEVPLDQDFSLNSHMDSNRRFSPGLQSTFNEDYDYGLNPPEESRLFPW